MSRTTRQLERINTNLVTLTAALTPANLEQHFHYTEPKAVLGTIKVDDDEVDDEAFDRTVYDPLARRAVLTVALMLKNHLDATDVAEGSHVLAVIEGYEEVTELRELLGRVDEVEVKEAEALWEILAN